MWLISVVFCVMWCGIGMCIVIVLLSWWRCRLLYWSSLVSCSVIGFVWMLCGCWMVFCRCMYMMLLVCCCY